jgi:glycosyltransferase 2 family protein
MRIKTYWLKLAVGIAIIALLLIFKVNLREISREFIHVQPLWIILAGALHIIGLLISAYRWQLLLGVMQVDAPLMGLLSAYLIGGFFNNFLPTRVGGDIYRMVASSKYTGSMLRPFAVIIVERLSGIYGLILIGITAAVLYPRFHEIRNLALALFILAVGGFLITLLFYGSKRFYQWLTNLTSKLPAKISTKLIGIFEAFWHFSRSKKTMVYVFVLGLLLQFNVILYYYLIARGIQMNMSLLEASLVMPLLICIQLLPLTPNGIGVREFSYIYLLKPFGVSEAQAVAFSFWDYILTFAYGLVGGILYLLRK